MFKRHIIILLLSGLCYGQFDLPEWIKYRPIDPDYYIGIGQVDIRGRSAVEYQSEANELAFLQISNQIGTQVSGETESFFYEDEESMIEKFTGLSRTSTVADLEGLALVDTYRDDKEYWVYWRLSKEKHDKNIEKYESLAKDFYIKSQKTIPGIGVVDELSFLVKAYESILRAHGKIIVVEAKETGEKEILNSFIPKRLEEIVAKIETKGKNTGQQGKQGKGLDAPLIFQANFQSLIVHPMNGLSVVFEVLSGDAKLERERMTNSSGECRSKVTQILSDLPKQTIQARIDLKPYKLKSAKNVVLDAFLDKLTGKRSVNYYITISKLAAENIAVKVLIRKEGGLSDVEAGFINDEFIVEISRSTEFEVMERELMDDVLMEQDFYATECGTDECQVQIGRLLAVRKMIYVLLGKLGSEIRGQVKLINIETGKIEHIQSVKWRNDIKSLLDEGIPRWVESFYSTMNLGRLSLSSPLFNISAYGDGEFWGELPIYDRELETSSYKVKFISPGYETLTKTYSMNLGQNIEDNIELRKKSRFKAFGKSMVFPGLGQFYSSDWNNTDRRTWGALFALTGVASVTGTAFMWYRFVEAQNVYNDAYEVYLKQNTIDDINTSRAIAQEKNKIMMDKQSVAIVISGVTGLLWVLNALESVINFPDYHVRLTSNDNPIGLSLANSNGQFRPTLTCSISF